MTISKRVQKELVLAKPSAAPSVVVADAPKRLSKTRAKMTREGKVKREEIAARTKGQAWTAEEHARFLEALQVFPSGPWEAVAEYVGTKNSRQTMTHAQKYRQKHERQQRGLRVQNNKKKKSAHCARDAAAPYPTIKKDSSAAELVVVTTPSMAAAVPTEVESPRSGEDECEKLLSPIVLDLFSSSMTDATFKFDGLSVFDHFFQDVDAVSVLPTWSTNSLTDNGTAVFMDELSALPDDFSQPLGLWVP